MELGKIMLSNEDLLFPGTIILRAEIMKCISVRLYRMPWKITNNMPSIMRGRIQQI